MTNSNIWNHYYDIINNPRLNRLKKKPIDLPPTISFKWRAFDCQFFRTSHDRRTLQWLQVVIKPRDWEHTRVEDGGFQYIARQQVDVRSWVASTREQATLSTKISCRAFLPIDNYDRLLHVLYQTKRPVAMTTYSTEAVDHCPLLFNDLRLIVDLIGFRTIVSSKRSDTRGTVFIGIPSAAGPVYRYRIEID